MKFIRSKKLLFANNKGGVGKTTLAYNMAVKCAELGYKTVIIDADPQCNISRLCLGDEFEGHIFDESQQTIYKVLSGVVLGGADINTSVTLNKIKENLYLLPGSMKLSEYENSLISAYGEAAQGAEKGFFITSALDRYLNIMGLREEIDIFIIDTSPTLGLLNRVLILGTDYFVTPMMPDAFSVQGIQNLGNTFEEWKDNWKKTAKILAQDKKITYDKVLNGEGLFVGYIVNSYNQYAGKPIKNNREWIEKIPEFVKKFLSEKHCRNGLVETSWRESLGVIKDYGQLVPLSQIKNQAIFNLNPEADGFSHIPGTMENWEQSKIEFENLVRNTLSRMGNY